MGTEWKLMEAAREWRDARRAVAAEPVADVRKTDTFKAALDRLATAEAELVKAVDAWEKD